jgi:hypothetical protein
MSDDGKKLTRKEVSDDPLTTNASDPNKKEWVKFEEEENSKVINNVTVKLAR